jgi:hypothetical protein
MRPEFKEQLLASLDSAAQCAGTASYEAGMVQLSTLLDKLQGWVSRMRTKEDLAALLDELAEEPTTEDEIYTIGLLQGLPSIMRELFTNQVPRLAESLPPPRTGRKHVLTLEQRILIRDYISELHRMGTPLQTSKKRAAQRFGVGVRSVERAWSKRMELNIDKPWVSVSELIAWMSK